jgi:hypothetical protein
MKIKVVIIDVLIVKDCEIHQDRVAYGRNRVQLVRFKMKLLSVIPIPRRHNQAQCLVPQIYFNQAQDVNSVTIRRQKRMCAKHSGPASPGPGTVESRRAERVPVRHFYFAVHDLQSFLSFFCFWKWVCLNVSQNIPDLPMYVSIVNLAVTFAPFQLLISAEFKQQLAVVCHSHQNGVQHPLIIALRGPWNNAWTQRLRLFSIAFRLFFSANLRCSVKDSSGVQSCSYSSPTHAPTRFPTCLPELRRRMTRRWE